MTYERVGKHYMTMQVLHVYIVISNTTFINENTQTLVYKYKSYPVKFKCYLLSTYSQRDEQHSILASISLVHFLSKDMCSTSP